MRKRGIWPLPCCACSKASTLHLLLLCLSRDLQLGLLASGANKAPLLCGFVGLPTQCWRIWRRAQSSCACGCLSAHQLCLCCYVFLEIYSVVCVPQEPTRRCCYMGLLGDRLHVGGFGAGHRAAALAWVLERLQMDGACYRMRLL